MNTTEKLISTGCLATAPQPINQVIKPVKFPAQPQEWKIVSLRECPTPDTMQQCETPDQAAAYWKAHIATHPYFNPECECLVVFILNTRRRIKGHELRRREIPSFEQFRADIAKLVGAAQTFQQQTTALVELLRSQPPAHRAERITRAAAIFATLAALLAGYLIGRAW